LISADRPFHAAERNLPNNGDFARGSGNSCDGWRVDAWILPPTAIEFKWIPPSSGEPAELNDTTAITMRGETDRAARTGLVLLQRRGGTVKILQFSSGTISVLEDSIMSTILNAPMTDQPGFICGWGPKVPDVDVAADRRLHELNRAPPSPSRQRG
jgi:hypothetical protein